MSRPRIRRAVLRLLPCVVLVLAGGPGHAVEAFDGRIQAHGFFEMQVRAISEDFSGELDLTQWYNIFNLELEFDILDQPVGPVDLVTAFVRAEVRYDCVWRRACGLFPSANTYGDRARDLPRRLSDSVEVDSAGAILLGNERSLSPEQAPVPLSQVRGFNIAATTAPASFAYTFERFERDFRFTQLVSRSGVNFDRNNQILGPWLPKNFVFGNAALADRINPFDPSSLTPPMAAVGAVSGSGGRPFRPIPVHPAGQVFAKGGPPRGLYIPSQPLREAIRNDAFSDIHHYFNFRQSELEWNRGLSQQQTKELKEAYLDIELFDSQLWLRIGRQTIVWGKTELFPTMDQFNPQDLALSSLPSLEESRIPLWSLRAIWNIYDHPLPIEDLRFELGINIDQYQASDLGTCGEPYTPNPVCQGVFGVFAHGLTGVGIAGVDVPPDPWEDFRGVELGGRVEWRWERFAFSLMDFWGFDDLPTVFRLSTYERNVDPATGLPRVFGSRGSCSALLVGVRYRRRGSACLQPGPQFRAGANMTQVVADASTDAVTGASVLNGPGRANARNNALDFHHANLSIFGFICSQTVGVDPQRPQADPAACAQTLFSSTAPLQGGLFGFGELVSGMLAGNPIFHGLFLQGATDGSGQLLLGVPLVLLSNDGGAAAREFVAGAQQGSPEGPTDNFAPGLSDLLTPEQEALLGCGPWWGTNCDQQGIDLLNADASVLLQSWVGIEGTGPSRNYRIPYNPPGGPATPVGRPQPGHVGYGAAPICTTGNLRSDGRNDRLPGCRNVGSRGYNVNVDGGVANIGYIPIAPAAALNAQLTFQGAGLQNPLHGQTFANELAAVSWNFMMFVTATDPAFRNRNAFRPGKCSYVSPHLCPNVADFFNLAGVTRNTTRAGGNYRFGRRTWQWHSGGEVLITVQRRNVLGFSMDFAEDRTKSNWSFEFTWINKQPFFDAEALDNVTVTDTLNLTISADRPTFINFLNHNRTVFFNGQLFVRYIPGHRVGFSGGPWNFLGTLTATTGYFQDRLLPTVTGVYDVRSNSGALLTQLTYRYTESFSLTLGASLFMGRESLHTMDVNPIATTANETGENAYRRASEGGLSVIRDRDELFFELRYTF